MLRGVNVKRVKEVSVSKYNLHKRLELIKAMFGFKKKDPDTISHTFPPNISSEDMEKRKFLEWYLKLIEGFKNFKPDSLKYTGNNTWMYSPDFGYNKEFILLKDMNQRQSPNVRYGKVNDQWTKLEHDGYYIIENTEGNNNE